MALRPLHLLGSPVLRERSAEVATVDDRVRAFIADLFETMDAEEGAGLAANQVGVAERVAVVDANGERFAMVNPRIVEMDGRQSGEEGCLSIPDVFGDVTRADRVVFDALDEEGREYRREVTGLAARAVQHEIDHLDGVLFIDHLGPIRRKMIIARWKKDHRDGTFIKPVEPKQRSPE
jgi:peptide deformylase